MSSIASTSELTSGVTAATPALFTRSVTAGLSRRIASTPRQIRFVVEVGRDRLDGAAGLPLQPLRQGAEPGLVAGNQDQVIAAPGEPVGIDFADAGGGAGDQGGTLGLGGDDGR